MLEEDVYPLLLCLFLPISRGRTGWHHRSLNAGAYYAQLPGPRFPGTYLLTSVSVF